MAMVYALPDHSSLTFLLGGARSGKSAHAESLIAALPAPWLYIATAQTLDLALDDEMSARIKTHQARRDERWTTIEAPLALTDVLTTIPTGQPVLIDCLTLWLTNQLLADRDVTMECDKLSRALAKPRGPWFAVANETGLGIVPANALARRFRDTAGQLNQRIARQADNVLMLVAGIPVQIKPGMEAAQNDEDQR